MQPMHDDCFEEILCSIDVTADPYDDVTFMGQIKTQVSHRLNVIQQSLRSYSAAIDGIINNLSLHIQID